MLGHQSTNASNPVALFQSDAAAYCSFVENLGSGDRKQLYSNLLRLLSALAKSACEIPLASPARDHARPKENDDEKLRQIGSNILDAVTPGCTALAEYYSSNEEARSRVWMLWDDLTDIYCDLRKGLDLYATGGNDEIEEAVWIWAFNFGSHWGHHLYRALQTILEIRYLIYSQ